MDLYTEMDKIYMLRALQLAKCGEGRVSPNPMVGAVIVYKGKIIGEGYHRQCGQAHAEVNAVNSVQDKALLAKSTMYVTLEPCSHFGKTPPCCDLIRRYMIPRVVVGMKDPFPEVSGRGITILQEAGIDVSVGLLEEECRFLNRKFITCHQQKRPYVLLKWCESSNGYIAKKRGGELRQVRLSSAISSLWMHSQRAVYDAILVGTSTALVDNPTLTVRGWCGKNPLRVLIDREGKVPVNSNLFTAEGEYLVFTDADSDVDMRLNYEKIDFSKNIVPQILESLYNRKVTSLMVEGGAATLQSFISSGLWDEVRREVSPIYISAGVKSPDFSGEYDDVYACGGSQIHVAYNRHI